eukprot:CAMPEP_0175897802 /NCGR_PEP_ID=MMETSP0108-20121206/914_1 /TAXON_ID=195067 ORGANISM="Goniomonas pacifica, Strain CCMP1869" /NCGR_SAMPLE_ID=MMETSP0108 /ASSEMBLY_ACC=CAM_ASM_000204 /LENGTH=104 /DNA_ID=CAMNT_0017219125 /DNA_START=212 /DNA_END=527 /DNA_ORIENTATION=+
MRVERFLSAPCGESRTSCAASVAAAWPIPPGPGRCTTPLRAGHIVLPTAQGDAARRSGDTGPMATSMSDSLTHPPRSPSGPVPTTGEASERAMPCTIWTTERSA